MKIKRRKFSFYEKRVPVEVEETGKGTWESIPRRG